MDDGLARRDATRPRRMSATATAAELGANASLQDGEVMELFPARETQLGPDRPGAAGGRTERRNPALQPVHQRHMPMEPLKFHIPRKTRENRALVHHVSTESREYEDMLTILTSSYIDSSSAGSFIYSTPRLVHSELQEKEFVEKRKEMKAEGRTDMELEESYCFLLVDAVKLPALCEKGLFVGQSWLTVLGNPNKGVYLSRYSDLLQVNPFTPGATGEILIFKVLKGKVKSMYENIKNLLDPTPRFDSHLSKNSSKVTSLTSYRAFELTQHYFYEYMFDELRQRPRHVCPYAVVSFEFKGKDSPLPSKSLAPVRLNSQSAEHSKERAQFTVWTGDLVNSDEVVFQIALRSSSPPFLPHKLPEKLEMGWLMRFEKVKELLPSDLFSYSLYSSSSSQEVVKHGHCCSLLEVVDGSRSKTSITRLLQELEDKRVVLVTQLTERGFLFLLSSVQMAAPSEREEGWRRCLHALFIFPETRDVSNTASSSSSEAADSQVSGSVVMPHLDQFIPALHHALVKARANPPPELSAGVERQAREYLMGQKDGTVRQYPMGEYDSNLDELKKPFPAPKHHRLNMDGYLRSYLYSPVLYLLSVARARQMVQAHCRTEKVQEARTRRSCGGKEETSNRDQHTRMQQMIDLVMTCKRNAENEVKKEEGRDGGTKVPGRKRRREQEMAERALKFLKASQEQDKIPAGDGGQVSAAPSSLASLISSLGLKDVDLKDGSELANKLLRLLTSLNQAANGSSNHSPPQEEVQREAWPFDRLAAKLGLPTNCDIDLRKQEELEEQTAGSVSSLEGFSPGSHSGEMNHHGAARGAGAGGGGGLGRRTGGYEEEEEEWEIPWILIPITGLCSERYAPRDRNLPQDPRFQHLATATGISTATGPHRKSRTPSPVPSPPPSPSMCPSPDPSPPPSPSQCPSPEPSPPPSPSRRLSLEPGPRPTPFQCPSPQPSPPHSPSQCPSPQTSPLCPSPQPSPPQSPSQCPSPQPSPHPSPSQCPPAQLSPPPSPSRESRGLNKDLSDANEEHVAPTACREFTGIMKDRDEKPQGEDKKNKELSMSVSERRTRSRSPGRGEDTGEEVEAVQAEQKETRLLKCGAEGNQEEVVDLTHQVEPQEQTGVSSLPGRPLRDIDSIVDKHLGEFSSDLQLLLQEENVHYSFTSASKPDSTSAPPPTPPSASISPFSRYVSFYHPCPPVQHYVSSLQDSISCMVTELDDSWKKRTSGSTDAVLASSVSAFVASIRAGKPDEEGSDPGVDAQDPQTTGLCGGGEAWWKNPAGQQADAAAAAVTLSAAPSAAGSSLITTNTTILHSKSPQPHWTQQQNQDPSETTRTVPHSLRPAAASSSWSGLGAGEAGTSPAAAEETPPGFSSSSKVEPAHPSERGSGPGPGSGPPPPATDLSSLISRLQPEVFNSLVEIIKDVKRNLLQFYIHSTEQDDQVHLEVKEYLLKQGNVEQNPVDFMNQESSDNRLLVVIKNKNIAGHIHKVPGLMSLKRHRSVMLVGIDTLDDIRNNSYNELFVSGGCIVSDELLLSPDCISPDRLASLLMLLEKHSSVDSVWRWKVHCKTHKKLKEQARFRRDAFNLLEVLTVYQKRQVVEFLPYHHCDMMNHQSPDLDCLIELQARYTQYRHTVFLTDHRFEKFPSYCSSGIIVAGVEELLHDFSKLVGYHHIKDKPSIIDDLLASRDPLHPLSYSDQPQPGSGLPPLPHLSDQLVPEASCKEGVVQHPDAYLEMLQQTICQMRAERQEQQKQQQLDVQSPRSTTFFPGQVCTGSGQVTPPLTSDPVRLTPGRVAVAATLELIHSNLQLEPGDENRKELREGAEPVGQGGGATHHHLSTPSTNHNAAAAATCDQTDSTNDRAADQPGDSGSSCPVEGDTSRVTSEQPIRGEGSAPGYRTSQVTPEYVAMVTDHKDDPHPAQPPLHQQHHQQTETPPYRHHRHGDGLLHRPHLPFPPVPMLPPPPLPNLHGVRGILGSVPAWSGGLGRVWGFQPDWNLPLYHSLAGQGGARSRGGGGHRGGGAGGGAGFNGR